jgi:2-phospho-L-lactate guanylyltransferase
MWALVPVKNLLQAKQRLSGVLSPDERRKLFRAMLEDVLTVLGNHPQLDDVLLVSDDPTAQLLAKYHRVAYLPESQLNVRGLNDVVQAAVDYLGTLGVSEVMVVHGDLPMIDGKEVSRLIDAHGKGDPSTVTLVPDRRGQGSNCIICRPGSGFRFCYGDNSLMLHRKAAAAIGASFNSVVLTGIGCDIDWPEDLLHLVEQVRESRAENTVRYLQEGSLMEGLKP